MDTYTIIIGLFTVIGVILQIPRVQKAFPKCRRYYTPATSFIFGLIIGFVLISLTGTSIHLPENITPINIIGFFLYGGTSIVILICFLSPFFVPNRERREDLSRTGTAASWFFIFLLVFFTSTFFPEPKENYITFDENMYLIEIAIKRENYDRALTLIKDQKRYLDVKDTRIPALNEMISEIHSLQITVHVNNPVLSTESDDKSPP